MKHLRLISLTILCLGISINAYAGVREQAKRIHDRITGVLPTETTLTQMENAINAGATQEQGAVAAAFIAMNNKNFYNVTLKNMITPWTNEAQTVFPEDMETEGTLNDYTATVIGVIRDDRDFREILFGDVLYTGLSSLGLPAYSNNNNAHYKALEERAGLDLQTDLIPANQAVQSTITGLPSNATAGVMTSRAAAKAFFYAGTNRAMFRFTMMNHLCNDMEQVKDVTRVPDRIRQDVSRSPGGDSRIFLNSCIGCHAGMDPMTQAFAYYDYDDAAGQMVYNDVGESDPVTGTRVTEKNLINPNNFSYGYVITNDDWDNYWRAGQNSLLGWDGGLTGSGSGAKSMGQELAYSAAFSRCQVEKVFKTVCLRAPGNGTDRTKIDSMITSFAASTYNLKQVFAESAAYCRGN